MEDDLRQPSPYCVSVQIVGAEFAGVCQSDVPGKRDLTRMMNPMTNAVPAMLQETTFDASCIDQAEWG